MIGRMKHRFLVVGFGFAWIAAGCGSVSTTSGTGGSGAQGTGGQAGGGAGTRGTGGAAGTGGTGGAAGTPGTGGAAGTPGTGGHAGAPGTGGHAGGKGGHGGDGGASGGRGGGTAGTVGTGGHAGAGGAAGGGGHGGQSCDELAAAFQAAIPVAESCTPGATHQCEQQALTGPLGGCAGCGRYVNDNTTLDALRAQYEQQGCPHSGICPAVLCIVPQMEGCKPTDASTGGTCTPIVSTGTN
jgi:hypothetical protein